MPSRSRGQQVGGYERRRRRELRRAAERDWADGLGVDALLAIFHRLGHVDVLLGAAEQVCRSWRRAVREEPSLWRRIAMVGQEGIARRINRGGMACEAVRRSAGQCESFCGVYAGDDGFLVYLSEQAPCLKSLRLISCCGVTNEGIAEAVKEFPLLEELELSLCDNVAGGFQVFEFVGEVCPQLKHFRLNRNRFDYTEWNRNKDVRGIATMHGLHSLQLFSNHLTDEGLETILNNCPHLEFLDMRHCFNINMDETLLLKCARIKTSRLPNDPTDDYDHEVQSPIRPYIPQEPDWYSDCCYSCHTRHYDSFVCSRKKNYDSDDSGDDSDFYGKTWDEPHFYDQPSRYENDLDKYEKMLPFNMRTFLK
ncbi:hypothetical protein HU200_056141 [Digitaria exilis]|uniref:F-box domain-containing protein n=1 Tax=Digitaria exilis TaxID=1010633 RepID=A0A835AM09_9POAL|nr:hypothetical protein HU200_056141 [Digitaria exilis]CAB3480296.1 unnamed protein product [Digitaria exilis]